jgi:hypothetical protein
MNELMSELMDHSRRMKPGTVGFHPEHVAISIGLTQHILFRFHQPTYLGFYLVLFGLRREPVRDKRHTRQDRHKDHPHHGPSDDSILVIAVM